MIATKSEMKNIVLDQFGFMNNTKKFSFIPDRLQIHLTIKITLNKFNAEIFSQDSLIK